MATATQRAEDVDKSAGMVEVSLAQKMLSAVSGSVLTSLLGVYTLLHSLSNVQYFITFSATIRVPYITTRISLRHFQCAI
jgi:solute carrier family 25 protein 39/40